MPAASGAQAFPAGGLFERGHREEAILIEYLTKIGIEVITKHRATGEPIGFEDYEGAFQGHVDAMAKLDDQWMVVEFKTHNDKSFKDLVKKQVRDAKLTHYAQIQIYMHYLKVQCALYLAVNKNDDSLYHEFIDYDPEQAEYYAERAGIIIRTTEPLERACLDPTYYLSRFCRFKEACFADFEAEQTAPHAKPWEIDSESF